MRLYLVLLALGAVTTWAALAFSGGDGARTPDETTLEAVSISKVADAPCPSCGQDAGYWTKSTAVPPPALLGKAAALLEGSCGRMIYGLEPNTRRPPASLVKIVTALVVFENTKPQDIVDVKVSGWRMSVEDGSSIMGLEEGMQLPVEELLYGLLYRSGNDAALALSDHLGGDVRMVGLLNDRVRKLGLKDTALQNPHGLDAPGAYSSPFDMAVLGRELLNVPYLRSIVSSKERSSEWWPEGMENGNWFMYSYDGAVGVKIGYTDGAGGTIVSAAERDGRLLIASVFDSVDVFQDSRRLLDWAFANVPRVC